MAGRGPAPKPKAQRRRANDPARGEWRDLQPLGKKRYLSATLPKRDRYEGPWTARTKRAWKAWREDPVTQMYGPAEIDAALELAYLHNDMVMGAGDAKPSEVRLRMDGLGLTLKGKRDLRYRVDGEAEQDQGGAPAPEPDRPLAPVRRLRAVDPRGAATG